MVTSRLRSVVRHGDAVIDTIVDRPAGEPDTGSATVVLLPSLGRDSEDFHELAQLLAAAGLPVLRPQPRGILGSTGLLAGITQHDLAADVAAVIRQLGGGRAVVGGHAYGNWVARQTATDFPGLVSGVMLIAAAARHAPKHLGQVVNDAGDPSLPELRRRAALREGFFAPGHDPSVWLTGWHPHVKAAQRAAADAVPREQWWGAGAAPILELHAEHDPFMPPGMRGDMRAAHGARVTTQVIADASHALIPEQPVAVAAAITRWVRALPAG
jgi:pimeloyl-ACP methyl ester carboxylesterase